MPCPSKARTSMASLGEGDGIDRPTAWSGLDLNQGLASGAHRKRAGAFYSARRRSRGLSFTHASVGLQWCARPQEGHSTGSAMDGNDSKMTVSVSKPVGTGSPITGQRIKMSGIGLPTQQGEVITSTDARRGGIKSSPSPRRRPARTAQRPSQSQ